MKERNTAADFDWEQRYADSDNVWSGHVNGSLVAQIANVEPGAALDIGCGEGADAIWLAQQGWQVVATDLSQTAIDRGRRAGEARGLEIDWRVGDTLAHRPAIGAFDLVSVQYPSFPIERCADVIDLLSRSVAPGGLLLVIGHAPAKDPASVPFDPADWVLVPDIAAALDPAWTVELHRIVPRPGDHHRDSPHTHDEIFQARRPVN